MKMLIDQKGLNNLLSIIQPKNSLNILREKRESQLQKLNQMISTSSNDTEKIGKCGNSVNGDIKQVIAELQASDEQIQLTVYEEKSRKLELERLKREEAMAKNPRQREKALAKQECVLYTASMNKLLSAKEKSSSEYSTIASTGTTLLYTKRLSETDSDGYLRHSSIQKAKEIDRDIKASIEFGIGAAEVARRRKYNHMKEESKEADNKKDTTGKKKKKISINITV
ncbi:MAG: hypothetical protein ACYDG2_03275 [Ruminiclostridium sp.]